MSHDNRGREEQGATCSPQGSSQGISTDQSVRLMSTICKSQARLQDELSAFKDEVRQGQEETATKALKKARHEKPYQYKNKGNKEQALFNVCNDEALAEAQLDLPGPGSLAALERAHKALERDRCLIAERQKLIRFADCSELGWNVVSKYTTDELADDSED